MNHPAAPTRRATHDSNHVAIAAFQTANSTSSYFLGPSTLQRSWMSANAGPSRVCLPSPSNNSIEAIQAEQRKENTSLTAAGKDPQQRRLDTSPTAGVDNGNSAVIRTVPTEHSGIHDQTSAPIETQHAGQNLASATPRDVSSHVPEYQSVPLPDARSPRLGDAIETPPTLTVTSQTLPGPSNNSLFLLPHSVPNLERVGLPPGERRDSRAAPATSDIAPPGPPSGSSHLTSLPDPPIQAAQQSATVDGSVTNGIISPLPFAPSSNTARPLGWLNPIPTQPAPSQVQGQSRKRPLETDGPDPNMSPSRAYTAHSHTGPPSSAAGTVPSNVQGAQGQRAMTASHLSSHLIGEQPELRLDHLVRILQQAGQYRNVEIQRVLLLREACQRNDLFYLFLHQTCALATLDSQCLVREFGFNEAHFRGFAIIDRVLVPNRELHRGTISLFAEFPFALNVVSAQPQLVQAMRATQKFLAHLADGWEPLRSLVHFRRHPPSPVEIWARFGNLSFLVQRILFTSLFRELNEDQFGFMDTAIQLFRVEYQILIAVLRSEEGRKIRREDCDNSVNFGSKYFQLRTQVARAGVQPASSGAIPLASSRPPGVLTTRGEMLNGNAAVDSTQYGASSRTLAPNTSAFPSAGGDATAAPAVLPTVIQGLQPDGQHVHARQLQAQQRRPTNISPWGPLPREFGHPTQGAHAAQSVNVMRTPQSQIGPVTVNHLTTSAGSAPVAHGWPLSQYNVTSRPPALSGGTARQFSNSIPAQRQPQSNIVPWLVPPPGQVLPRSVNPPTEYIARHQAHLRTPLPQKVNAQGLADPEIRLYQIFEAFVLKPQVITTKTPYIEWPFHLTAGALSSRVEDVCTTSNSTERVMRRYMPGSTTYRLRCIRVPEGAGAEDASTWATAATYWPSCAFASMNGSHLEPRLKAHHGKDLPVDVTGFVREGDNTVQFSIHYEIEEKKTTYALAVERVKVVDHAQALKMPQFIDSATSLENMTKSLITSTDDDDIQVVDSTVSVDLVDPFTAKMFNTPVRGRTCTHRDCFDLEAFLLSRTSRVKNGPTNPDEWKCPICNKDARPQCLIVDGFLSGVRDDLLQEGHLDTRFIKIMADGTWFFKPEEKGNERRNSDDREDADKDTDPSALLTPAATIVVDLDD